MMKTDAINSWQELASIVERFHEGTWIFRGVENAQYELIPRVGRPNTSYDLRTSTPLDYSPKFEELCIEQFKREAKPHMHVQPQSELEWLSIAQHYGLPTRLLDWSESPLIAAYFAVQERGFVGKNENLTDAAIYGMKIPDTVTKDEELTNSSNVVAYFPSHLSARITAQRGLFTYHRHLRQAYGSEGLVKWVLPGTICFTLKVILNKCGINEASMFPDLGGIARHVRWLLKWPQLLSGGS